MTISKPTDETSGSVDVNFCGGSVLDALGELALGISTAAEKISEAMGIPHDTVVQCLCASVIEVNKKLSGDKKSIDASGFDFDKFLNTIGYVREDK